MKHLAVFAAVFPPACGTVGAGEHKAATAVRHFAALAADAPFRGEILQFATEDREDRPPRCPVLFVGSSSIRVWDSLAADMVPMPLLNCGLGSSSITHVNRYFDGIGGRYEPRAIVFCAGENDFDSAQSAAEVTAEFGRLLQLKQSKLGDAPVFYISAKPSEVRFNQLARQSELNAAIRDVAATRKDLIYLGVAAPMMSDGHPKAIYLGGGLHMQRSGCVIWRELVRDGLRRSNLALRRCRG